MTRVFARGSPGAIPWWPGMVGAYTIASLHFFWGLAACSCLSHKTALPKWPPLKLLHPKCLQGWVKPRAFAEGLMYSF